MNSMQDSLRDTKREVAPFVPRTAVPNDKYTRLTLEEIADFVWAQVPHFRDLDYSIVTLGGYDVLLLW